MQAICKLSTQMSFPLCTNCIYFKQVLPLCIPICIKYTKPPVIVFATVCRKDENKCGEFGYDFIHK